MVLVATFAVFMLIFSYYTIDNVNLIIRSGLLVTKISLSSITEVLTVQNEKGKKLMLSYGEKNLPFFIQINELFFNDFSAKLINANPKIAYNVGYENSKPTQE